MLNIIKNNKEAFVLLGIIVISGVIMILNAEKLHTVMNGMYDINRAWSNLR